MLDVEFYVDTVFCSFRSLKNVIYLYGFAFPSNKNLAAIYPFLTVCHVCFLTVFRFSLSHSFPQVDHEMAPTDFVSVFLIGFHRISCIDWFMFFIQFGDFKAITVVCHPLLVLFHGSPKLCTFIAPVLASLGFYLHNYYWCIFKFSHHFVWKTPSFLKPIWYSFSLTYPSFSSTNSIRFFFMNPLSHLHHKCAFP